MSQESKPVEDIITRAAVIQFTPDYRASSIDLPVGLWFFRDPDDENAIGSSDLTVLLDALRSHKRVVKKWPDSSDKANTLATIRDMKALLLERTWERLSQATGLLHSIKYELNNLHRNEPLA